MFPAEEDTNISDFIVKGSNVATIIQCGGIWVANGKFGVTWKLFQAVVKPKTTLSGKCHISLSSDDKEKIAASVVDTEEDEIVEKMNSTVVEDSDDEESLTTIPLETKVKEVKEEVAEEVEKKVALEDQPKKKRVVKKKVDA